MLTFSFSRKNVLRSLTNTSKVYYVTFEEILRDIRYEILGQSDNGIYLKSSMNIRNDITKIINKFGEFKKIKTVSYFDNAESIMCKKSNQKQLIDELNAYIVMMKLVQ